MSANNNHHGFSPLRALIRFCLENRLVVFLLAIFLVGWGLYTAPFDWDIAALPRDPVPVDAIPDLGENQQIVFTQWMGRSPRDVEDQISYPLTVSLLGVPGVKTIRSYSMFGFSTVYVIFKEDVDFYWSRSRVLEKLSSLPPGSLPEGVSPSLGPDATGMGQIFWYTLEGRDPDGNPAGGWGPQELRSIQDWQVRYALQSAEGVSEVASVGGFEKEYQIDVDPDAMRAYGVTLPEIFNATKRSNIDVGARTIEINSVEYVIRGLGFIESLEDIENIVVKARPGGVPVTLRQVARVVEGPAPRRGALDKAGAEAVGGVVVARYGANPLQVIKNVKEKIEEVSVGLPRKTLEDGTISQVTIVPFYDRTGLINETLKTLKDAIRDQILVTMIVVLALILNLRASGLISSLLPLTALATFVLMKLAGVDANVVALSGIAIAIGTVADMGIVLCENAIRRLEDAPSDADSLDVVADASTEVGSAVLTAVATTVVSFLPVFAMTGAEGKLFKPLAYTKTFALIASIVLTLTILPPLILHFFGGRRRKPWRRILNIFLFAGGLWLVWAGILWQGIALASIGLWGVAESSVRERGSQATWWMRGAQAIGSLATAFLVAGILARTWEPLGPAGGEWRNFIFVTVLAFGLLGLFGLFMLAYERLLKLFLRFKVLFIALPLLLLVFGLCVWLGFAAVFSWAPASFRESPLGEKLEKALPGLGREFMPPLDEGSFLYMPVTMPHASIGEAMEQLSTIDMAIQAIPEVDQVVGKIGRVESPLDPAPLSMIETVINYKSEYIQSDLGERLTFQYDDAKEDFSRDENGALIADPDGRPFRQWRDHIKTPDDIWDEIVEAAKVPGLTSAPKLQPIAARIVMLQSGMRAPMGVKVRGPDLETIERVGLQIEEMLKNVEGVQPLAVIADRVVGKPYLEIDIDRERAARLGIKVQDIQDVIETALGGKMITRSVEGRERYAIRARYQRELRDSVEAIGRVLVPGQAMAGMAPPQIPLDELAEINYVRGPQVIKSEDIFLLGYVLFDKLSGWAEIEVIENAKAYLKDHLDSQLPAGVSYSFAGTYENQVRARKTLSVVLPVSLFLIFIILYLQFRSSRVAALIFTGVAVAWSGGFLMIWLYGQPWFLNFDVFGVSMRDLFQVGPVNLSVAVWVGFLALFGIATDDGVVMATYIKQSFDQKRPETIEEIRETVLEAGKRRVRPCLMTTATTVLALLPVLTSTGRGSDVMVPMAIPSFGGMAIELVTLFVVPVLYCATEEMKLIAPEEGKKETV